MLVVSYRTVIWTNFSTRTTVMTLNITLKSQTATSCFWNLFFESEFQKTSSWNHHFLFRFQTKTQKKNNNSFDIFQTIHFQKKTRCSSFFCPTFFILHFEQFNRNHPRLCKGTVTAPSEGLEVGRAASIFCQTQVSPKRVLGRLLPIRNKGWTTSGNLERFLGIVGSSGNNFSIFLDLSWTKKQLNTFFEEFWIFLDRFG